MRNEVVFSELVARLQSGLEFRSSCCGGCEPPGLGAVLELGFRESRETTECWRESSGAVAGFFL